MGGYGISCAHDQILAGNTILMAVGGHTFAFCETFQLHFPLPPPIYLFELSKLWTFILLAQKFKTILYLNENSQTECIQKILFAIQNFTFFFD